MAKKEKAKLFIPFEENGNMMNYCDWILELDDEERAICLRDGVYTKTYKYRNSTLEHKAVWRPNCEFEASIEYDSYENRRSSTLMYVHDLNTGVRYPMFIAEYDKMMKAVRTMSVIKGTFTFVKRGANYSIVWVK